MASYQSNDQPLQELRHDAVPGYPMVFAISLVVMSVYLAVILFSSRGQVDHYHHDNKSKQESRHSESSQSGELQQPNNVK